MTVGIFFLCCMDAIVKVLAESYSILQLVWIRYTGQMAVAAALIVPHLRTAIRTCNFTLQVSRSLLSYLGTIAFFLGFTRIDLAAAAAILQVSPLIIAAMAYFLLGERFGWRTFVGICVGLAGALIIIRPGTSAFSVYALFPLLAAVGFSGFAILTRFMSRSESIWTSFFYTTLIAAIMSSAVVPFHWTPPMIEHAWLLIMVGLFASAGQFFLILALFVTNASTVAPFTYSAVVFAAILGLIVFGEVPDLWTYVGAVVVAGSGIFVWHREMLKKKLES